jgi:GT2 family glycosyltransferase
MSEPASPRFAVIIPAFNAAETLRQAVDSVLAQTCAPHEIIVVDDGSTDDTAAVATGYGARVTLIRQQNSGVSAARNAGARAATADLLCFLDADDWYYPDRLEAYAGMIRQEPALDFLTGDFDYVDAQGKHLRRSMETTPAGRVMLDRARDGRAVMEGAVLGEFIAAHFGDTHTLTVPRATFLELGGYPTGFAVCEDVNFLIRLCARSRRVGVVCKPTAAYRIHGNSATRSDPLRAQLQTLAALKALVPQLRLSPPAIRHGLRDAIRHARLDLAQCLLRMGRRRDAVAAAMPLLGHGNAEALRGALWIIKGALLARNHAR